MFNVFFLSYSNTDQLPEFPDQDMVFTHTILEELTLGKLVKRIWIKKETLFSHDVEQQKKS